jgi:molybdopterin molybdotransferase
MIPLAEARRLIASATDGRRMGTERLPVEWAGGRTLGRDVTARTDKPVSAISAMDGFAVRFADMRIGTRLRVTGIARAGVPAAVSVGSGEAVRIFTGALVPEGADHILIQEDARLSGAVVEVLCDQKSPSSIRARGRDFSAGSLLAPAGTRLGASALSLVAAGGWGEVEVSCEPVVAVLATGEELRPAGDFLEPGQTANSVSPALSALIRKWGGRPLDLGIANDTVEDILAKISAPFDVVVTVGGASVGDFDVVRSAFEQSGFRKIFEKIAVKPGKPAWFSDKGKVLALGLPGNPAAAIVTARLLLKPLIEGLLGAPAQDPRLVARSQSALPETAGREEYLRAHIAFGDDGVARIRAAEDQDSSLVNPFLTANALIVRPPRAPRLEAGELVEALLLEPPLAL